MDAEEEEPLGEGGHEGEGAGDFFPLEIAFYL
jgi:hypothetical protein